MKNTSLAGPILLIVLGVLFLLYNLNPRLPLLQWVSLYWPWLLVIWGTLRLAEILLWAARSRPLPRAGVSGGEWAIVISICLVGSAADFARNRWPGARITRHGIEMFGQAYDFPVSAARPAGDARSVVVENLRGNVRIAGAEVGEVRVQGRATVRAFDRARAEELNRQMPFEVGIQGDQVVVRTNQGQTGETQRVSSDLEILVPVAISVVVRGREGDIDVANIAGDASIESGNAGVRLAEIGGSARIDVKRSDVVRAVNLKGGVTLRGRGQDVEIENAGGPVTVTGTFSGDLQFRSLAQGLEFESQRTNFRARQVPGQVRLALGRLVGTGLEGPVRLKARTRDVELGDFTGETEIEVERGSVKLRPARLPLGPMTVAVKSGDIELAAPPGAKFSLAAAVDHGDISNEIGEPFRLERRDHGAKLEGGKGQKPEIRLRTERGAITLRQMPGGALPARAGKQEAPRLVVEKY